MDAPPEAKPVASLLHHAMEVVQSGLEIEQVITQLKAEQDSARITLTALTSELALVGQQQQEWSQQLAALERRRQERMDALRTELEAKLEDELTRAQRQIADEHRQDLARQAQAFERRQSEALSKALEQDGEMQERELQQVSRDIEIRTQELLERLVRLDAGPEAGAALTRATEQALAARHASLEARRHQRATERETLLAKRCGDFTQQVTQQQQAELQQRLMIKEARLRSAMAALLDQTDREAAAERVQVRLGLDEILQRANRLAQQEGSLRSQAGAMDREIETAIARLRGLEAERRSSVDRLEQAFLQVDLAARPVALGWLTRTIRFVPPEAVPELVSLHERLVVSLEQEQRLHEQRRLVREREHALQLSRDIASQRRQRQLRQQQELEASSRKADGLLGKARQRMTAGAFDHALQLLAQAQALNPPQANQVASVRDEVIGAKAEAQRRDEAVRIKRLFAEAIHLFEEGRYDEAVPLFDQVIAQEATLDPSRQFAGQSTAR